MMFGWGVNTVTVDELASRLEEDKKVLIDVREPREFATGHVPRAVNVPLGTLATKLGRLDPAAETYVICQSGNRSRSAVKLLVRTGFTSVYNVKGGTSAWRGRLVR
jgi:rhodanese-related sulfurtransferase